MPRVRIRDVVGPWIDDYLQGEPVPPRTRALIERLMAQYGGGKT